ncbi:MAG: hypothetical protein K5985_10175 [Lachnospiraceae bacterium]|nr:hypothetical protein [Lachnospiraceae bacterium]
MDEKTYKDTLAALVRLAHEQKNLISEADYVRVMGPLSMTEEQDALTRSYLKEIRIRFEGEEDEVTEKPTGSEETGENGEGEEDHLSFYLNSLSDLSVTDEAEKKELFDRIKKGDASAEERLVEIYLKDAAEIAGLYVTEALTPEDLISEGNLGLLKAVRELNTLNDYEETEAYITKGIMDAIDEALALAQREKKEEDALLKKLYLNLRKGTENNNEGGTA